MLSDRKMWPTGKVTPPSNNKIITQHHWVGERGRLLNFVVALNT